MHIQAHIGIAGTNIYAHIALYAYIAPIGTHVLRAELYTHAQSQSHISGTNARHT